MSLFDWCLDFIKSLLVCLCIYQTSDIQYRCIPSGFNPSASLKKEYVNMIMETTQIVFIIGCLVNTPLNGKVFTFIGEHGPQINGSSPQVYGRIEVSRPHRAPNATVQYCKRNFSTLTCTLIPKVVPPGITNVIVEEQDRAIEKDQFLDKSWTKVDSLYIEGTNFNLRKGGMFNRLENLTTLYLNISDIDRVSSSAFVDLDGLKNLTLVGMETLDGLSLQLAISNNGSLPELKYFALNSGKTLRSPFLQLQYIFLESLVEKRIECLNLSNVILEVQLIDFVTTFLKHNFQALNLTGSYLILKHFNPEEYVEKLPVTIHLPLVTTLDTSYMRVANVETVLGSNLMSTENESTYPFEVPKIADALFLVENFYTNSILLDRAEYRGIFNYSSKPFFWKKFVFTGNYIAIINATFVFPQNNTLLHIDLSNNKIEYLNNGVFNTCVALQVLDLSINSLYLMQHLSEFGGLLVNLNNLRYFNLANNNISFIPKKMFHFNVQLETLILENNRLMSVSFNLGQFSKVRLLDIRTNCIRFLQNNELDSIQILQRKVNLDILFQGNPIVCSCETFSFITWLASLRGTGGVPGDELQCEFDGRYIDVNEDAVGKCRYLCKRTMIVAVSTSCSSIVFVAFIVMIRIIQNTRKRKRMQNIEWLLMESIQAGDFMCFVAMSGEEEELVNRVILQNLRRCLREKVNVDRDIVCTGTRFKPGFPICEESYRLVKKSHVFMAVVSAAFIRSQYCRLELQEACKQDKPTLLLFYGHVDTTDMPEYMREVFKRNSCAWIKQNHEGYYYVVPSVQDISGAIWDLALVELMRKV